MLVRKVSLIFLFLNLINSTLTQNPFFGNGTIWEQIPLTLLKISLKLPDGQCKNQILSFGNAIAKSENWAVSMLDAMAKPQAGLLMGNLMHIGNYDQCLKIDEVVGLERVQGKYCSAFFGPHPTYGKELESWFYDILSSVTKIEEVDKLVVAAKLSYGFCIPKVCTATNLQNLTNILEDEFKFSVHFNFDDEYCDAGDGIPFTKSAIASIVIFSFFGALLVFSSLYDVFLHKEKGPSIFTAFSVVSNGRKLLSTSSTEGSLNCLNGLRVISMMWIVLAHWFQYSFFLPHVNGADVLDKWRNATESAFIAGSSISVDTFFIISGLLVVYLFMKSRDKGVQFSLPMFYLHRILRLTPSLAMVIVFTMTLANYMGSGPFWPIVEEMLYKPCEDKWWSTLIYLQNYINPNDQCVGQAWYLAVDTQMYFLSPLVLFPLVKWPKYTIAAIMVFVVLNCSYVFEITWKMHLGSTFFNQDDVQYRYIYAPTHVRGTVYLLGMVCGYYVYKMKTSKPLKLSKVKVTFLWLFSLAILAVIVLGHSVMMKEPEYNVLTASFFNSLTRVGWSLGICIIIILCVNDYGGPINSFLSNPVFTVLIRLNYNVYLLHLMLMMIIAAQERTSTYFSNLGGFHHFWGDYVFSLGAAFIWTLAFESPILIIEKLIFGKKKSTQKESLVEVRNGKHKVDSVSVEVTEDRSTWSGVAIGQNGQMSAVPGQ